MQRKPHPSGRPLRNEREVGRPIWRVPDDGYVTPRLRLKTYESAIGFTARLTAQEDDED
jgi:hypothetical protein